MRNVVVLATFFSLLTPSALAQVDVTSRFRHVFPQIVDGRFADGSSYITSFTITNVSPGQTFCSITLGGLRRNRLHRSSVTIPSGGFSLISTTNISTFDQGYAVVSCSQWVTATATYGYLSPSGRTLGMATVFSSQAATGGRLVVVQGDGTRMGFAMVNDSPFTHHYQLTLADQFGRILNVRTLTLAPGGHLARFVDELVHVPSGFFVGSLSILGTAGFNAIGLFHDGAVFSTTPVTVFH